MSGRLAIFGVRSVLIYRLCVLFYRDHHRASTTESSYTPCMAAPKCAQKSVLASTPTLSMRSNQKQSQNKGNSQQCGAIPDSNGLERLKRGHYVRVAVPSQRRSAYSSGLIQTMLMIGMRLLYFLHVIEYRYFSASSTIGICMLVLKISDFSRRSTWASSRSPSR